MYYNISTTGATNLYAGPIHKVLITVNTAVPGTITVSDETGTTGSPVVAVITNPSAGAIFEYYTLSSGICVNANAVGNFTVSLDVSRQGLPQ